MSRLRLRSRKNASSSFFVGRYMMLIGVVAARMRQPISSVVKCALSRMAPLPFSSATSRCSRPSMREIARMRSFDAHHDIAVSSRPMPRLSK